MRPRRPAGLVLRFGFCVIIFAFNRNLKAKKLNANRPSRPKREPRPRRQPQLRTPRGVDNQRTESRIFTNNMPLMPVNTASITSVEPVAHGAVPHEIECCCTLKNCVLQQVMMLFEQHPYFRAAQISRCRIPAPLQQQWSASRVGILPSFFRAGRRLYRSWTVHQCWCSTLTVDSFSFLILALVCQAYPAFVLHPRFPPKP